MNGHSKPLSPPLYLEICSNSFKALHADEGLELILERLPNGRLTDTCKEKLTTSLQNFLKRKNWQPRGRAYCAIGARGVSLRRLALPPAGKEEFQRILRMQIESEFPLAPDELAWGYRSLGESHQNGSTRQDLLVMAVKRDIVQEYSDILTQCGVSPVYTLAALARSMVCPQPIRTCALLDVGLSHSELILFEDGVPSSVRVFPWGDQSFTASPEALDALSKSLNGAGSARKLFLSGRVTGLKDRLAKQIGECEPLAVASGEGRSAAVLGLKKSVEESRDLLLFQAASAESRMPAGRPAVRKWAAIAAGLAAALLVLPYAEAILLKGMLAKRVSTLKADAARLPIIDRELNFLQSLKQSQPPYLDALFLFAKSAPSGMRIDSVTMNSRGEVSLRGSMRNSDQVAEFRSKLIASGFFSSVSVDEQTPTPDRQKLNVRMTATWKSFNERQSLSFGPTPQEIEKAKTNQTAQAGGSMPGMPPGMSLPPGASLPPGFNMPPGMEMPSGPPPRPPRP